MIVAEDYLELVNDWSDPYDLPVLVNHDDVIVVRDDVLPAEAKSGSSINLSETQTVKSGSLEVQTKSVGDQSR